MEKITLVAGLIVLSFILFKYVDANGPLWTSGCVPNSAVYLNGDSSLSPSILDIPTKNKDFIAPCKTACENNPNCNFFAYINVTSMSGTTKAHCAFYGSSYSLYPLNCAVKGAVRTYLYRY